MALFSPRVETLLPEAPTMFYSMTQKQSMVGTKINADIPVVSVLIILEFSGSTLSVGWGQ